MRWSRVLIFVFIFARVKVVGFDDSFLLSLAI